MTPQGPRTARQGVRIKDATWRDDYPISLKFNHKHADGTTVAHEPDDYCPALRLERIEAEAAPPDALRACPRCGLVWPHTATFRSPGEKEQHTWPPLAAPAGSRVAPLDVERLARAIDASWGELLAPLGGQPDGLLRSAAAIAATYSEEGAG